VAATGFGSTIQMVLTPEQFKKMAGRDVGQKATGGSGCACCN